MQVAEHAAAVAAATGSLAFVGGLALARALALERVVGSVVSGGEAALFVVLAALATALASYALVHTARVRAVPAQGNAYTMAITLVIVSAGLTLMLLVTALAAWSWRNALGVTAALAWLELVVYWASTLTYVRVDAAKEQ
jgi:hypothetical protein